MGENVAQVNQALAEGSIEQITAMALKAAEGGSEVIDQGGAAATGEQDVGAQASSGQADGVDGTQAKQSDKELNFARLRSRTEALEKEKQALEEQVKALNERSFKAELPADHAQKVEELETRVADLGEQFQDGELTFEEYQTAMRKVDADREQLLADSIKAQIAKELQEKQQREAQERAAREAEAASKTWAETVDSFIKSKPDSVDYSTDEAKRASLNTYVKAIAADPDNEGKPMEWFLQEAHTLVRAKYGIAASAKAAPGNVDEPAKLDQHPPINTLSDLPGGQLAARSEIEQLSNISGAALTNRFLNMTPAQIEAELQKMA